MRNETNKLHLKVSAATYISIVILIFLRSIVSAENDYPDWIDTVPPKIKIHPANKWQKKNFLITFNTNENAIIYYSFQSDKEMDRYTQPISITKEGTYRVYFYGTDDYTNKSMIDTSVYVLDKQPPLIQINPESGTYKKETKLIVSCDENASIFLLKDSADTNGFPVKDSIILKTDVTGYLIAVDSAGNRTVSEKISYRVDTTISNPQIYPVEGVYNTNKIISFGTFAETETYYSFDPLLPKKWFNKYKSPIPLPYGLSIVRYYNKNKWGNESEVFRARYIVDTIPPKIQSKLSKGVVADTLYLNTREQTEIRFEFGRVNPSKESQLYTNPIVIQHKGKCIFRACAWDVAGNSSAIFNWECKYDSVPPEIIASPAGGVFTKPFTLYLSLNEPGKIFYTLDGTSVSNKSKIYNGEGILLSRENITVVRYIGVDEAENSTDENKITFIIDSRPPKISARIKKSAFDSCFEVSLVPDEKATIFYELDKEPEKTSKIYTVPIKIQNTQTINYFAIDQAGNQTPVIVMDELKRPMVQAMPVGGIFNSKLKLSFRTNRDGNVFARVLPENQFSKVDENVVLDKEGNYTLEYYFEDLGGQRSPVKRGEYVLDWTSPEININVRKGMNDSLIIFFEASENASIYYTTDGSNPAFSSSTKIAGNKYSLSKDRVELSRKDCSKLAFYAEDITGNQSSISVLDLSNPRVIPNIPAGNEHIYDKIVSLTLSTIDKSTIYYSRNGRMPTTDSSVYSAPITLLKSDTILAFVVDLTGFRGPVDTFVYLIDLPPLAQFRVNSNAVEKNTDVLFDASGTIDNETPFDQLLFRWDFDGDGAFDTDAGRYPLVKHTYLQTGKYNVICEITDSRNRKSVSSKMIYVNDVCPPDMISVIRDNGTSYCIDKYEWPNIYNENPMVNISWVEAKMSCIDVGKRLCTSEEWVDACRTSKSNIYSYGNAYDPRKCPTEGEKYYRSGFFKDCNPLHANDMIGNVWEWVENKDGEYPMMYGGSYRYGKNAHCKLIANGTVASKTKDVGFRCCK